MWLNNDSNGYLGAMRSNEWANDGHNWYYVDASGDMMSGWQWVRGQWYWLNPRHDGGFGRMLTGWQFDGAAWYYLDQTGGHMLRDTVVPDGGRAGPSGKWIGWEAVTLTNLERLT